MSSEQQDGLSRQRIFPHVDTQIPMRSQHYHSTRNIAQLQGENCNKPARRESQSEELGMEYGRSAGFDATPVKALLSSNVTPRSGSRKARVKTTSPALNGTPNGSPTPSRSAWRASPIEDVRATNGLGLPISNGGRKSRTGSLMSDGQGSSVSTRSISKERKDSATTVSNPKDGPKFFHVNDVKPAMLSQSTPENKIFKDTTSAVNQVEERYAPTAQVSLRDSNSTSDDTRAKFLKAGNSIESRSPPPRLANGNYSIRPQLQTIYSAHASSSPPRAPSPLKEEILPRKSSVSKAAPRRHTRLVSNGGSERKSSDDASPRKGDICRRSSLSSPRHSREGPHVRSPSVPSISQNRSRRSSVSLPDVSPVKRIQTPPVMGLNRALPQEASSPTVTQEVFEPRATQQPKSPTKSETNGLSKIEQMNELAATARRERKVLDLEISNSSLLAINRTLEHEMRKQNAELRRFRRLSRCGRVSMSRAASGMKPPLSETDITIESDDLVSSSEDEGNATDMVSSPSSNSTTSRPSSLKSRAARTRFQDPNYRELDTAAQRALLLDSRILNSAIKRCLSHTEELIVAGKQALNFQALVSHSEQESGLLSPRVLRPDESENSILGQGQGLLSPSHGQPGVNPWEQSLEVIDNFDSEMKTPDYSQWGPSSQAQTPLTDAPEPLHHLSSGLEKIDRFGKEIEDPVANSVISSIPSTHGDHRASEIASIDGVEDDTNDELQDGLDSQVDEQVSGEEEYPNPYTEDTDRMEKMKPPDHHFEQPGYRGSMQGLGHYLQAFSVFGKQQK